MSRETGPRPVLVSSPVGWWRGDPSARTAGAPLDLDAATVGLSGPVTLALGRRSVFVRSTPVPPASASQTAAALTLRLPQLVPLPPDQVAWTHAVHAGHALVMATAAPALAERKSELTAARLRVVAAVPLALGSEVLCRRLGLPDAVVVERTPEGLGLDVVRGGHLAYSRVAAVPEDVEAVRAEIARTLAAAQVDAETSVVAAGGLALPFATKSVPEGVAEALVADPPTPERSLEPPAEAARRRRRKEQARLRLAALMLVASVMLNLMVLWDRQDQAEVLRRSEAKYRDELRRLRQSRDAAARASSDAAKSADPLRRAFQPAQRPSEVLVVVGNLAPSGAWLTGATIERGKPLQIRGTAKDNPAVASYVERLATQDRLRDVRLVFANGGTIDDAPVVNFAIAATAVGNLPVVEPKRGGRSGASAPRGSTP